MMCANTLYATLSKGAFILLLHLLCRTLKSTAWRKPFKPELKKPLARAQMKRSVKSLSGILICPIFFLSSSSCCLSSTTKES